MVMPLLYLRMSHWSTFGQIRHSSGKGAFSGRPRFRSPEKWAHLAGESNTFGYSVALMALTAVVTNNIITVVKVM